MQNHESEKERRNSQRRSTDKSLGVERTKTNESINEARKKTEAKTDRNVDSRRDAVDQKTSNERDAADSSLPVSSDVATSMLEEERSSADRKLQLERSQSDEAIKKERTVTKRETFEFLKRERGETDKNLKSERDQYDESVTQYLKSKVMVTSRDELIAILSHDLRNPIGAILSASEMLQQETEEESHQRLLELITRNAKISLQLIQDIFEMENISQGKFDLKLEKQNIFDLLQECVDNYAYAAVEKNIYLKYVPEDEIVEIVFDRARLSQVLSNIIGNAIKFTPPGGKVAIGSHLTSDEVIITISDNGLGIPEDKQDLIFDRFSQIASKTRTGLGLGLYISKIFIEAHKGKISVESQPGKGSTFFISLNRHFGAK